MDKKIRMGITIGDPSGIGPEVTIKSLKRFKVPSDCEIFVFGDRVALDKVGLKKKVNKINLVDLRLLKRSELKLGILSKKFGLYSFQYLSEAVKFLKAGIVNCIVTAPVSKEAISLNKIKFPGHTEFLATKFKVKDFVMMFISRNLKVSLVTRHLPLKEVSKSIKKEDVFKAITLTSMAMKDYFGISRPKIAVSGLNPHAGEDGLMGTEEERIIKPVIIQLRKKSNTIYGPIPADTLFKRTLSKEFDAVVCMYHDQGLIPFKMLNFFNGINLTLGLPFVRTSCVHGTAFNIAGKDKANCNSMLAAINLAYRLTKNRLRN